MRHLIDQQGAGVPPCPPLTWRHKAPTGVPARTLVRVGGEGTTSASAVDRSGDGAWIARATLPSGVCKRFRELPCFDGYVAVWRAAGFLLTWHGPRTVVITRGGLDAGPQRPTEAAAQATYSTPHTDTPHHGQARSAHCQVRLLRRQQPQPVSLRVQHRRRGHLPVHQAGAVRAAVALGQGMSQKPAQPAFAWWDTPTTRALRTSPTQPATGVHRRPFSRPTPTTLQRAFSALPKAEIFLFTGSNTPYESHE